MALICGKYGAKNFYCEAIHNIAILVDESKTEFKGSYFNCSVEIEICGWLITGVNSALSGELFFVSYFEKVAADLWRVALGAISYARLGTCVVKGEKL